MISIITPTHGGSKYLKDLYETIKSQSYKDWEWIIVENNGGDTKIVEGDPKVHVYHIENPDKSVGRAKRFACQQARGEIYLEADHDDLLTPDCLEEVARAFEDPEISQVYSNFAEFFFNHPTMKDWESNKYGAGWGWRYRDFVWEGHRLNECLDFDPSPVSFGMIWSAPNHVRAWRTTHYWEAGGHDESLPAVDDFDLECRVYLKGKFKHIDKCLYLYRMTGGNTWIEKNKFIQEKAREVADKYMNQIVYRWSEINNYQNLKLEEVPTSLDEPLPYTDNTFAVVRAWDKLQFCSNPIQLMKEIYRVLIPGGWLLSSTPSTDGRGAFENPLFKSYWNDNSFNYYTRRLFSERIGNPDARFQEVRRKTYYPNDWCKEAQMPYVLFNAIAIKPGIPRVYGYKDWPE